MPIAALVARTATPVVSPLPFLTAATTLTVLDDVDYDDGPQVAAGSPFDVSALFDTGLTVGVGLVQNGSYVVARTAAVEYPAGSGIYQATLTAPAVPGHYFAVWDDGVTFAVEDVFVASGISAVPSVSVSLTAATVTSLTLTPV